MGSSGSYSAYSKTEINFKDKTKNTKEDIEKALRLNLKVWESVESVDEDDEDEEERLMIKEDFDGVNLQRVFRGYKEARSYMQGTTFVAGFGGVEASIYYDNDNSDSDKIENKVQKDLIKFVESGFITLEEIFKGYVLEGDGDAY